LYLLKVILHSAAKPDGTTVEVGLPT